MFVSFVAVVLGVTPLLLTATLVMFVFLIAVALGVTPLLLIVFFVVKSPPVDASRRERLLLVLLLARPVSYLTAREAEATQFSKIIDVGCIKFDGGPHLWGTHIASLLNGFQFGGRRPLLSVSC